MRLPPLLLLLTACSSSSAPVEPARCNQSDRHGTYVVRFAVTSGNCPAIPDATVTLMPGAMACGVEHTVWSENDCHLAVDGHCQADGGYSFAVETTQKSTDGSYLEGREMLTTSTCSGVYAITYTRK